MHPGRCATAGSARRTVGGSTGVRRRKEGGKTAIRHLHAAPCGRLPGVPEGERMSPSLTGIAARGRGRECRDTPGRPHRVGEHGRFRGCASSGRTEAVADRGGTGDLRCGLLAAHRPEIARVRPSDRTSPGARGRRPSAGRAGRHLVEHRSWTAVAGAVPRTGRSWRRRRGQAAEAGAARPDPFTGQSGPCAGHHGGRGSAAPRHRARPSPLGLARDGRSLSARGLTRTRAAPVPSTAPHGAGDRCGTRSAPAAPGPWCGPCPRSAGARW